MHKMVLVMTLHAWIVQGMQELQSGNEVMDLKNSNPMIKDSIEQSKAPEVHAPVNGFPVTMPNGDELFFHNKPFFSKRRVHCNTRYYAQMNASQSNLWILRLVNLLASENAFWELKRGDLSAMIKDMEAFKGPWSGKEVYIQKHATADRLPRKCWGVKVGFEIIDKNGKLIPPMTVDEAAALKELHQKHVGEPFFKMYEKHIEGFPVTAPNGDVLFFDSKPFLCKFKETHGVRYYKQINAPKSDSWILRLSNKNDADPDSKQACWQLKRGNISTVRKSKSHFVQWDRREKGVYTQAYAAPDRLPRNCWSVGLNHNGIIVDKDGNSIPPITKDEDTELRKLHHMHVGIPFFQWVKLPVWLR